MKRKKRLAIIVYLLASVFVLSACGRQAKLDAANAAVESMIGDLGSDIDNLEDISELSYPQTPTSVDYEALEEDMNKNSLEQPTTLSDDIFSYQISIDGNIIQFPISYDDFTALGFQLKVDNPQDVTLASWGYDSFGRVTRDGIDYSYTIYNVDINSLPLTRCLIGGITVYAQDVKEIEVLMPGNLNLKDATMEDIKRMYGEPSEERGDADDEDDFPVLTYKEDVMNQYEFTFHAGKLFYVRIENLIVPRGFKSGEVNNEVPESVTLYKRPTALTNDPRDFVVQLDKDYYQLPCPVSEFTKNGWEIKDIEKYEYVIAHGSGSLTLLKGDSFGVGVNFVNYSDSATDINNCFVTQLSDSNEHELVLSGQIKVGDKEADVKKKLSELKLDYNENGSEHTYIYRDENNFFTSIYFTFQDGILKHIYLQNKPEYEEYLSR